MDQKIELDDFFTVESILTSARICENYARNLFNYEKQEDIGKNSNIEDFIQKIKKEQGDVQHIELDASIQQMDAFESVLSKYSDPDVLIKKTLDDLSSLGIDRILCFIYMERVFITMNEKIDRKYSKPYINHKDILTLVKFTKQELLELLKKYYFKYIELQEIVDAEVDKTKEENKENSNDFLSEKILLLKSNVSSFYNINYEYYEKMPISEFFYLIKGVEFSKKSKNIKEDGK